MRYSGSGHTPSAMHRNAKATIAQRRLAGGSSGRSPESLWKKTNHGNLMPACRNTPAEAAASSSQTVSRFPSLAACEIIDLDTNPEVSGNEEMDRAPIVPQTVVSGIEWNRPPSSEHLRRPVISST